MQFVEIANPPPASGSAHGILNFSAIEATMLRIRKAIEEAKPKRIFTLGGTCAVEVIPVTWSNLISKGDLAVVWFDAHADLNTPESSPSSRFHGMPVRTILGEGNTDLCQLAFPHLNPNQIFLVGTRDFDTSESDFVAQTDVQTLPHDINPDELIERICRAGFSNVYIHFDLDVLDPNEFDDMIFHVEGGMKCDTALQLVQRLTNDLNVVGSSLLEYVPRGNGKMDFIRRLATHLAEEEI